MKKSERLSLLVSHSWASLQASHTAGLHCKRLTQLGPSLSQAELQVREGGGELYPQDLQPLTANAVEKHVEVYRHLCHLCLCSFLLAQHVRLPVNVGPQVARALWHQPVTDGLEEEDDLALSAGISARQRRERMSAHERTQVNLRHEGASLPLCACAGNRPRQPQHHVMVIVFEERAPLHHRPVPLHPSRRVPQHLLNALQIPNHSGRSSQEHLVFRHSRQSLDLDLMPSSQLHPWQLLGVQDRV
mmetsp:Transcript_15208/g.51271  ORF Transcript_15208/g.51271 Transcript_15208/m.51271 type:complete len:245 (-) Transcript_15208:1868-2602(-)